jgi:hypothetical protein
LVDDMNPVEELLEPESGGESLPETEEQGTGGEAAEQESPVAPEGEELDKVSARLIELEQVLEVKDEEIAALKQAETEMEERLETLNRSLAEAVASYKSVLVQANPEVIGELISGESIVSIDESLQKAKALVSKVKQGVEEEISLAKVPVGAPERTSPDLSALSPQEKIRYAIGGRE